jgi:peptide-methionine (R)-S-oxide reductase
MMNPLKKSEEEWRRELSSDAFHVLREHGTERAFTGKYHKHYEEGVYHCAGCGNPLFSSLDKYDSGTGWPSFIEPISTKSVGMKIDRTLYIPRTEVYCAQCGGHLGHVFTDGPPPNGLRYCINSAALVFKER